jgi:hypothetical protein
MRTFLVRLFMIVLVLAIPASAFAGSLTLSIATEGHGTWNTTPSGTPNPDGSMHYVGGWVAGSGMWSCNWDLTTSADPFVSAHYSMTNTTAFPQTYTVTAVQTVSPALLSTFIGGSTGGSVTDANFNGLGGLGTVAPTAFYQAYLDATMVLALYPHPYSTTPFLFQGDTVNIPNVSAGLPGPSIASGPVLSQISIQHKFTLSAGDSVALTSFFVVTPEPATLAMLAFGSLMIMRKRR